MLAAAVVLAAACGKKGPPLPPLSNRPRAPEAVSARRQGDQVQIRFTVPRANQSGVQPANLERVEVYALTGRRLPAARLLEHAAIVATVPIRRPPPAEGEEEQPGPAPPADALEQGAQAVVTEALAPAAFEPVAIEDDEEEKRKREEEENRRRSSATMSLRRTPLAPPAIGPYVPPPPVRHYVVVGVNRSGRRGSPSPVVGVPLTDPPPAPEPPRLEVRERSVELTWVAPAGMAMPAPEAAGAQGMSPLPSRRLGTPGVAPAGFNVYLARRAPDPAAEGSLSPYLAASGPELLTPSPRPETTYSDTQAKFGLERCYLVTAVKTFGTSVIESGFSRPACVKVADVFPPAAPRSLAAVAGGNSVNLSWDANGEADLRGYLVMRSDSADAPLEPIFEQPITETTWNDTTVRPGMRYRYAVVAIDKATPPNRSGPSNEVEVSVR